MYDKLLPRAKVSCFAIFSNRVSGRLACYSTYYKSNRPHILWNSSFGTKGVDDGQSQYPWDVAYYDNTGHVYVADTDNNRVQVFTAEGEYVRQFEMKGSDSEELIWCFCRQ